ncbi:MAG: hypothetical protein M3355_07915, partial [Actinomycetota bacterium]|nr:hypothetical protein [Actinomycetota bacterium]
MRAQRRLLLGLSFLSVALGSSASASAAVECLVSPERAELSVRLTGASDSAQIGPRSLEASDIQVENGAVECEGPPPTVHSIDTITIRDLTGRSTYVGIDYPEFFGPGDSSAGGDAGARTMNEIEINVLMGQGTRDQVGLLSAKPEKARWRYGSRGVNPLVEPRSDPNRDADIFLQGSERHLARPHATASVVGTGGAGTGGPFPDPLTLEGSFGADRLVGGSASDLIAGSFGDDRLLGMGDRDEIRADDGADLVSGGRGVDTAVWPYSGTDSQVRVDIGVGGANDGAAGRDESEDGRRRDRVLGDIENLVGSEEADVLIGDEDANRITGNDRHDILKGRGGPDHLIDDIALDNTIGDAFFGGRGNDLLDARDEWRDRKLRCGLGRDRLLRDDIDPRGEGC